MALALLSPRTPRPAADFSVGRSRVQLYLGDCLSILPVLPRQLVGVVVTSPPYNLGIKYRSYQDDLPADGVPELDRPLAPRGRRACWRRRARSS